MPVSPARTAAFEILLRVETQDAYSSELLHTSRYEKLSPVDHGLTTELVLGVLRWRSLLDQQIAKYCLQQPQKLDPEVRTSLRLGAYQIMFLDRIPKRAAVHESVEMVKRARKSSAAGLVNAVLRKLAPYALQPGIRSFQQPAELADRYAHPLWLVERWTKAFGFDNAQEICEYDQKVPPASIRLSDPSLEHQLIRDGVKLARSPLLVSARRIFEGDVARTKLVRERQGVLQDEASQLVALLVGQGNSILDCCAAPGGKTRILAERNPAAWIIASEIHPHRARLLRKLVPARNVEVIVADARNLPTNRFFDRVLADVPCSGTGTLARNPDIKWRLKAEHLAELQVRQLAILQAAMRHVAPGGRIVYSTCSLEPEENGEVVQKALAQNKSFRVLDCRQLLDELRMMNELVWKDLNSLTNGLYLRTIPGVHPCDGFFAAVLEKAQSPNA